MKLIKDVKIKKLHFNVDERGRLIEILRNDDEIFQQFGQLYITTAYPGVVKGWHYHKKQDDYFYVIKGMAKIVLYDNREGSETKGLINEFFMGDYNQMVLKIPKNVLHGFKCISEKECLIMNCPTYSYNPAEPDEYRLPAHTTEIPYDWSRKDG
ncbi:MAG TPA: dTDP-4-dehydrorhamnose 3,5-epimerase family protein [bacterium]|nr:dTDP-4-dehydrorhamnose 3,5-epimerase family protein [bacterium]HPP88174.1 dTDP-4-dehydrorhamnose 3,5-epimerase family protein [bacterium]